jgi:hypothetical protein
VNPASDGMTEMKSLVKEVLEEASTQIHPILDQAWNDHIVKLIISYPIKKRTEEALKSRKARRPVGGSSSSTIIQMSDGEKVKLQLFLDFEMFRKHVNDVGVEPTTVIGLFKLNELTEEGERLLEQQQQQQQQQQTTVKAASNMTGK